MFELGFGKNVFVGVDIGTSAIKMVEIKAAGGKPVLSNYAWASFGEFKKIGQENQASFDSALSLYIKAMIKEAGIVGKYTHASIPAFGGLVTLINLPAMGLEDMEQAIRFEASKYIPTSLEEVVLSWVVLEDENKPVFSKPEDGFSETESPKSKDKVQVLLVAASKGKVEQCEKMVKNAGFKLQSIEIESFSMVRSLIGNDPGNFVIIDIGSRVCNIILVEKGIIKANRNIDAGGRDLTKAIAKSMQINDERAERMKISGKNLFASDSYINFSTLELITGEVTRMISSIQKKQEIMKIDSVILSGGSANMYGLEEYFKGALGVKVMKGNPFSRVSFDEKLNPMVEKIATRFSVCMGLALKGFENNNK